MTNTEKFRTVARALQPYITDTYNLLNAADAVLKAQGAVSFTPDPWAQSTTPEFSHAVLVQVALGSDAVLDFLIAGKKINAIKELRALTFAGLRAAKLAVEDAKVVEAVAACIKDHDLAALRTKLTGEPAPWDIVPQGDPWDEHYDRDEPPF